MDERAEIGVVVVTYNSRVHVLACLEALSGAAPGLDLDVVVVDNASGDGTTEVLRERFPGLNVIENQENIGFAAAVNQGARVVRGDYLLLLNPDAVMTAGSLAALVGALEADPRVGIAGPQLCNPDGSLQPSAWKAPGLLSLGFDALLLRNLFPRSRLHFVAFQEGEPRDVDCLSGACLLVRRRCLEALGGLDERFFLYHEDIDLCLRAKEAGFRVQLVPAARVRHALGASAFQDRRLFCLRFHESRRLLILKHHPGLKGSLMAALHEMGLVLRVLAYGGLGWLARDSERRAEAGHHWAALRHLHAGTSRGAGARLRA